jgi:hypothetical protein
MRMGQKMAEIHNIFDIPITPEDVQFLKEMVRTGGKYYPFVSEYANPPTEAPILTDHPFQEE